MNETPTPISAFEESIGTISALVPTEWLPRDPSFPKPTILATLHDAVSDVPVLESLAAAVVRKETQILLESHSKDISAFTYTTLTRIIENLPVLPESIQNEPLFDHHELFILEHDTAAPLNNVQDRIYLKHPDFIPVCETLIAARKTYGQLRYRYEETTYHAISDLSHAYNKLMKEYILLSVLPVLQDTLRAGLPIGTSELYELRSAYRELVKLDPLTWAVSLPLRTTLEEFIQNQKFRDKNTQKPVTVQFAEDCPDPRVFIDPGDLFRMTRNLLRDAVTHGDGPTITPIIHIREQDSVVEYSIYSPGQLDPQTLAIIGKEPYTTQDRGAKLHGYGKVGARKLLTSLWESVGASPVTIDTLFNNHWSNTTLDGSPFVRWTAPLPVAG